MNFPLLSLIILGCQQDEPATTELEAEASSHEAEPNPIDFSFIKDTTGFSEAELDYLEIAGENSFLEESDYRKEGLLEELSKSIPTALARKSNAKKAFFKGYIDREFSNWDPKIKNQYAEFVYRNDLKMSLSQFYQLTQNLKALHSILENPGFVLGAAIIYTMGFGNIYERCCQSGNEKQLNYTRKSI